MLTAGLGRIRASSQLTGRELCGSRPAKAAPILSGQSPPMNAAGSLYPGT